VREILRVVGPRILRNAEFGAQEGGADFATSSSAA
jgi:hypothetical protein